MNMENLEKNGCAGTIVIVVFEYEWKTAVRSYSQLPSQF
jgi:hypothetical protein